MVPDLPDPEFAKFLASLGVGGAIAGLLFFFYRKDVANYTAQWKGQSEMMQKVVVDNTAAITANTEVIRSLQGQINRMEENHRAGGHDRESPFLRPERRGRPR